MGAEPLEKGQGFPTAASRDQVLISSCQEPRGRRYYHPHVTDVETEDQKILPKVTELVGGRTGTGVPGTWPPKIRDAFAAPHLPLGTGVLAHGPLHELWSHTAGQAAGTRARQLGFHSSVCT